MDPIILLTEIPIITFNLINKIIKAKTYRYAIFFIVCTYMLHIQLWNSKYFSF